jgi:hypothetical protein
VPNNAAIAPDTSSAAAGTTPRAANATSAAPPTCDPIPANARAAASNTSGDTNMNDTVTILIRPGNSSVGKTTEAEIYMRVMSKSWNGKISS